MTAQIDFENLLKQAIGLDSASVGGATIEGAVRLRMTTLGINQTDHYWNIVSQSDEELQELIEAVVVPETWFFRDQEAFSALARVVTNEWLPSHPTGILRLLSGPCCTGEEPYSMAMALLDAGLSRERLQIDAVDISVRALSRARRGVYGLNSFRGGQLSFRDRYFEVAEGGFRLPEWIRKIVNFQKANLLSPDFGAGMLPYDVIFCRNVLIYFDHNTQRRVLNKLANVLTSSGFLFVGPAETFLAASSGFRSVNLSMSFAFRRSIATQKAPEVMFNPKLAKRVKRYRKDRPPHEVPALPSVSVTAPNTTVADRLDQAKQLADAGRLAEARELCEVHLKQDASSFEAYYLLGVVRDSMGDAEMAAQFYRKALYLDPDHYETLTHLALLSDRLGHKAAAQKLYERARRVATGNGR